MQLESGQLGLIQGYLGLSQGCLQTGSIQLGQKRPFVHPVALFDTYLLNFPTGIEIQIRIIHYSYSPASVHGGCRLPAAGVAAAAWAGVEGRAEGVLAELDRLCLRASRQPHNRQ